MPIISVSLNEKNLKDIEFLKKELGYSGKSEIIRDGLRMLLSDKKEKASLKGKIDGVIVIIHNDKQSEIISTIRHKHQEIISTQVHNHLENNKCLEIFVVSGPAEKIIALSKEFQIEKKIEFVKLIIS